MEFSAKPALQNQSEAKISLDLDRMYECSSRNDDIVDLHATCWTSKFEFDMSESETENLKLQW